MPVKGNQNPTKTMKNSHVAVIDERPLCPKAGVGEGSSLYN